MKILKNRLNFLTCIIVFLSTVGVTKSSIVVDFRGYVEAGQQRLQVVSFNTKKQMLLHHETMPLAAFDRPLSGFLSQHYPAAPLDPELGYRVSLNAAGRFEIQRVGAVIPGAVSREAYTILSSAQIHTNGVGITALSASLDKYYWNSRDLVQMNPAEISALVPAVQKEAAGDFAIIHPTLVQLRQLHKDDKGKLGELLTRITMFSFGYDSLPSLYESNHGLDGIFRRFDGLYMIITQSKGGDTNDRAPTVMVKELNEKHIFVRIGRMEGCNRPLVVASAAIVRQFLQDRSENVYKMAHCLLDKGKAQLLLQKLSYQDLIPGDVKLYNAPEAEKASVVQTALAMFEADPAEQLRLSLSALNISDIPRADAMEVFLQAMGFDADQREPYLDMLAEEDE
jgi:hypothetical protein